MSSDYRNFLFKIPILILEKVFFTFNHGIPVIKYSKNFYSEITVFQMKNFHNLGPLIAEFRNDVNL